MTPPWRAGRRSLLLLPMVGLLVGLLAGCVGLPQDGPVRTEPASELLEEEAPVDFTPDGPRRGAAPVEIVRGFLVAMQATPLNTSVARRYLSTESSSSWVPEQGTVIYAAEARTALGRDVRLDLSSTVELDERGGWLGKRGDVSIRMQMVRERGQWRISEPPDRLLIPASHFESRYNQYHLYYFDKSGEVLVPEPVHVPGGAQAPTVLVNGLLRGPERHLLGVERTFLPADTVLDDISVPVSRDGAAEVPLSDEVLDLGEDRLDRAFAQLAWTLGQVPGIESIRVTVDGSPLELAGKGTDASVDAWAGLTPAVAWANQSLFGVRAGRVVSIVSGEERRISGVFGSVELGVEEVAVDLPGEQVAVTTDGASTVLVASRAREPGVVPEPEDARVVVSGARRLLPPAWDLHGHLWLVDRTSAGAEVSVMRRGDVEQLQVDGVSGEDVRSFALSRDGTRLAVEVAGPHRDRLVVARVARDQEGTVRRVLPAERLPLEALRVTRVRDLAFRTPATVALLTAPAADTSQVVLVKVDGSSTVADATSAADVFRGRADRLVAAPAQGAGLYVHTVDDLMYALASNGRWVTAGIEPGLRAPTFVG